MPTPTVWPSSGPMDGVSCVCGVTVVNVVAPSAVPASSPSAVAVSV
jgi:hypothetical protein